MLHRVPHGFTFPSFAVGTMWNLWFYGNGVEKICAYRLIDPKVDLVTKKCKVNHSRCRTVFTRMIQIAAENNIIARSQDLNKANDQRVYEIAFNKLLDEIYGARMPSRPDSLNINTIGNRIYKK